MRAFRVLLCVAGLLALPCVRAQEPERDDNHSSHRLDFLSMPEGNLNDLLRQRLASKHGDQFASKIKALNPNFKLEDIDKLKEKLQDPAFLKQLENLPPGFREMFKGMSANDLKDKLTPEILDQVKAQLQKQKVGADPPGDETADQPNTGKPAAGASPTGPERRPMGMPPSGDDGKEAETEDALANSRVGDFLERFARKVDPKWRDSPAAHRFLRALGEHMGERDKRWEQLARGASSMAAKWSELGRSVHLERVVSAERANWISKLIPKSMPLKLAQRLSDAGPPQVSGAPDPDGPRSAGGWSWLAALAGAGLLALVLWQVLTRSTGEEDPLAEARRRLGPWPLDPATVASREDLIRAFEYLSVLRIGPAARNWNHRHIASKLSATQTGTADEVATLYERARYAPSEDLLPENSFEQARRGLCALAGVEGK
jgi:hypothetical protein